MTNAKTIMGLLISMGAMTLGWFAPGLAPIAFAAPTPGITLNVAVDGSAEFRSIQQALDTIPNNNTQRINIELKDGLYYEKVRITQDRITLRGESRDGVVIRFDAPKIEYDKRIDALGPAVVNVFGNDVIVENLSVDNCQRSTGLHAFAIYGQPDRMIVKDCDVISSGGDTLSLWNTEFGRYYHANCRFEGGVDFVCPRGWCFIRDSQFVSRNRSAILWQDGHMDLDMKFVLRDCTFDGPPKTQLGRNHYPSQFYLLDCTLSENITDKPIENVHKMELWEDAALWERKYFHNVRRSGGDYPWHADNLDTAPYSPAPAAITPAWTFGGTWDPESTDPPRVVSVETDGDKIIVQFSEPVAGFDHAAVSRRNGGSASYVSGDGTHRITFAGGESGARPASLDSNGDTLYGTVATIAPRVIASAIDLPTATSVKPITVMLIGDSTLANDPPGHMYQGFGWSLERFFDDRVTVVNKARNGRSTESFKLEGLWDEARKIKADYVMIGFGHNDNLGKGPGRETTPGPGGTFRENLRMYVKGIREEMGAVPILVSPAARRFFTEDGRIHHPDHEGNLPYAEAVRIVAAELNVPVVDLNTLTQELFLRLGEQTSNKLQSNRDTTHWSPYGSRRIAAIVLSELQPQLPELEPYIIPDSLTRPERR